MYAADPPPSETSRPSARRRAILTPHGVSPTTTGGGSAPRWSLRSALLRGDHQVVPVADEGAVASSVGLECDAHQVLAEGGSAPDVETGRGRRTSARSRSGRSPRTPRVRRTVGSLLPCTTSGRGRGRP